jgi:hypothetical protein
MASVEDLNQVPEGDPAAPPARSVRRATARRASARRATARSRHRDGEASIVGFLMGHPFSTIGDLARGLNLDPAYVATCVAHLSLAGEIQKAAGGYTTLQPMGSLGQAGLGSMAGQSE